MTRPFDRAAEDLGNSIHFEHVNVQVPDQHLATLFYVTGLGLTRDPYLMVSDTNMWINVGRSQFHLPSGKPQVVRGHTGLVIEGRDALLNRLVVVPFYPISREVLQQIIKLNLSRVERRETQHQTA